MWWLSMKLGFLNLSVTVLSRGFNIWQCVYFHKNKIFIPMAYQSQKVKLKD